MSQKKYASLTTLQAFLDNLKNLFATKEELKESIDGQVNGIDILIENDLLPATTDTSGAILTDENGKIILRY